MCLPRDLGRCVLAARCIILHAGRSKVWQVLPQLCRQCHDTVAQCQPARALATLSHLNKNMYISLLACDVCDMVRRTDIPFIARVWSNKVQRTLQ